jgi:hypothetical protein
MASCVDASGTDGGDAGGGPVTNANVQSTGAVMISAKLIELIQIQAKNLTRDVAQDLVTNPRTPGFRAVLKDDLEQRVFELFHHLGNWIGNPKSEKVEAEFSEWGRRRFHQGIPLSEIVYAMIMLKQHLRRYIHDNGLVDAAFPRTESDYVLPMHLYSLQDLNNRVGEFFDEALYYLARGYEAEARLSAASTAR